MTIQLHKTTVIWSVRVLRMKKKIPKMSFWNYLDYLNSLNIMFIHVPISKIITKGFLKALKKNHNAAMYIYVNKLFCESHFIECEYRI